jgi:hypothetical protein
VFDKLLQADEPLFDVSDLGTAHGHPGSGAATKGTEPTDI